jgi:hypothetical protein
MLDGVDFFYHGDRKAFVGSGLRRLSQKSTDERKRATIVYQDIVECLAGADLIPPFCQKGGQGGFSLSGYKSP